jgi:hypothetical protein
VQRESEITRTFKRQNDVSPTVRLKAFVQHPSPDPVPKNGGGTANFDWIGMAKYEPEVAIIEF